MKNLLILICTLFYNSTFAEQYLYLIHSKSKELRQYKIAPEDGQLNLIKTYPQQNQPLRFTVSPNKDFLVLTLKDADSYSLKTYKLTSDGHLSALGETTAPFTGPAIITKKGNHFIHYIYAKNEVSTYELKDHTFTGKILAKKTFPNHPHDLGLSLDQNLLFIPHNKVNRLYQFNFDHQTGTFSPLPTPYIKGPNLEEKGFANFRSLAFHPHQKVFYCSYEHSGGVASLKYDKNGAALWQQFSTKPDDIAVAPSTINLTQDAEFLYVANRFKRNLRNDSTIAAFKIDPHTGKILNRIGVFKSTVKSPRQIITDLKNKFLFLSSPGAATLSTHKINPDGSLTQLRESPLGTTSMFCIER